MDALMTRYSMLSKALAGAATKYHADVTSNDSYSTQKQNK